MQETLPKKDLDSILGARHQDFLTNSTVHSHIVDLTLPGIHGMFGDYEYPVLSWPILIDPDRTHDMGKICVELPRLLNQIPSLYFKNDKTKIADFYFYGNEMLGEISLMAHEKRHEPSYRLDLTFDKDGFKVLEANIGSALGGYEVLYFQEAIRNMHKPLSNPDTHADYHCRDTTLHYIKFIVDQIIEHVDDLSGEINLFANFEESQTTNDVIHVTIIHEALQEELKKRGLRGGAYTTKMSHLESKGAGELYLKGKRIHALLMLSLSKQVPTDVFRAFICNKLYYPDHLGIEVVLSDKRNLGLLRELAYDGHFNEADTKLILDYIPWTTGVKKNKQVRYNGEQQDLLNLLKNNKDLFVLKEANGAQGKNVFVGKFMSPDKWDAAIEQSLGEVPYVAQEFSDPVDFLAPNKNNEWVPYKLIWGAFGFGDQYGGAFVRMSEVDSGLDVINAATGAIEAIVFEY